MRLGDRQQGTFAAGIGQDVDALDCSNFLDIEICKRPFSEN